MKGIGRRLGLGRIAAGGMLAGALALAGCEGDSGGSLGDGHDFGANDRNLYVAFGDSITAGSGLGDPGECYSVKLAGMLGKTVINEGYPGAESGAGADLIHGLLDGYQPGFVLILFGVNDLIMGYGEDAVMVNLRVMVQACRDNKTIPVVATLTPVLYSYRGLGNGVDRVNARIRDMCSELGVACVDLAEAFGANETLMQPDGLHPNATGHAVMATAFYDVVQ